MRQTIGPGNVGSSGMEYDTPFKINMAAGIKNIPHECYYPIGLWRYFSLILTIMGLLQNSFAGG